MTFFVEPFEGFFSGAVRILEHIKAERMKTEIRNGVLFVGPKEKIDDELRWLITDHAPELTGLIAVEDEDVAWRVGSMLRQLAPLAWPCTIPTLFALQNAEPHKKDCTSCGEMKAVGEGDSYICGPCVRAKSLALELWMQRPAQNVRAA
jgi:hypothetical protein